LKRLVKIVLFLEYGDDIIVIDLGIDFPGPDLPGIDYILPDVTYLEENKEFFLENSSIGLNSLPEPFNNSWEDYLSEKKFY